MTRDKHWGQSAWECLAKGVQLSFTGHYSSALLPSGLFLMVSPKALLSSLLFLTRIFSPYSTRQVTPGGKRPFSLVPTAFSLRPHSSLFVSTPRRDRQLLGCCPPRHLPWGYMSGPCFFRCFSSFHHPLVTFPIILKIYQQENGFTYRENYQNNLRGSIFMKAYYFTDLGCLGKLPLWGSTTDLF